MPQSFWDALATYTSELAPVAGPLLSAVSETASAIERAGTQTRSLNIRADTITRQLPPEVSPKPRRRTPRKRVSTVDSE